MWLVVSTMHTLASRRSVANPNSASLVRSTPRLLLTRHRHPLHLTIPPLTATWPHPYQFLNLLHTRLPLLLHPRLLLLPHIPVALIVDLRLLLLGPIMNNLPSPISLPLTRSCACTLPPTFALPCSIDFYFYFYYSIYSWSVEKYVDISLDKFPQLEFVPTIHGREDISKMHLLTKGYAKRVKTFNE